jgi:hypothetical protein
MSGQGGSRLRDERKLLDFDERAIAREFCPETATFWLNGDFLTHETLRWCF